MYNLSVMCVIMWLRSSEVMKSRRRSSYVNYIRRRCVKRKERNYNNTPKPLLIYPSSCPILLLPCVPSLPVMTHVVSHIHDSYMTQSTQPSFSRNQGNTCNNHIRESIPPFLNSNSYEPKFSSHLHYTKVQV
jgi:hypothetical protein